VWDRGPLEGGATTVVFVPMVGSVVAAPLVMVCRVVVVAATVVVLHTVLVVVGCLTRLVFGQC
jgi:hypothetical protein